MNTEEEKINFFIPLSLQENVGKFWITLTKPLLHRINCNQSNIYIYYIKQMFRKFFFKRRIKISYKKLASEISLRTLTT